MRLHRAGRPRRAIAATDATVVIAVSCLALFLAAASVHRSTVFETTPTAAGAGLVLEETGNGITCRSDAQAAASVSAALCPGINRLGGDLEMAPGRTVTTTITLTNAGGMAASALVLSPQAACSQSRLAGAASGSARDLCVRIAVTVRAGSRPLFTGTAAELTDDLIVARALRPASTVTVTLTATLGADAGNAYQGLGAALPVRWSLTP